MRKTLGRLVALMVPLPVGVVALTLDEAVSLALEHNPDLEAAEQRIEAARAMLEQARSAYYPWLTASAQYARSDNPPQAFMMTLNQRQLNMMDPAFNPNEPETTDNLRRSLFAQWRLFDFGQREASVEMARLAKALSETMACVMRNQLVFEVTRAFYQALQAKGFVSVQAETVKSIEESLRIARERFAAGSAMKTDVLNLETQLAQAREDLIRAQNALELAIAALNTVIGQTVARADQLEESEIRVTTHFDLQNTDLEPLIDHRPEWKAASLTRQLKRASWKKAYREYGPTISAFASADWDGEGLNDPEQSHTAGIMAEWRLFEGFRVRQAVAAARAEYRSAEAEARKTRDQLRLDLNRSRLNLQEAHQRLEVTRKNLESAKEALRITREQYEQGAADIALLMQAQVGVTAMLTRNIAAEYDYLIAVADWHRAQGRSLEAVNLTQRRKE